MMKEGSGKTGIWRAAGGLSMLLGAAVTLTPHWLVPVCEHYGKFAEMKSGALMPMRCHWLAQAEMTVGIITIIVGALLLFARGAETRRSASLLLFVLGLAVFALPQPFLIGVCVKADMACHLTGAVLKGLAAALMVTGAAAPLLDALPGRGTGRAVTGD